MTIRRVWQIACGEKGRWYDDLFREHDIMFQGPGRFGPYDSSTYNCGKAKDYFSQNKIGQVRRFVRSVHPYDIILLRKGQKVVSIGLVGDGGYQHNSAFDDVYGWDLQHTRRVLWQEHLDGDLEKIQQSDSDLFAGHAQMPTFTRVRNLAVLDRIEGLFDRCRTRPLRALPNCPPAPLSLEEFGDALFSKGLSYDAVHRVKITLEKQRRLLSWYSERDSASDGKPRLAPKRPSEHEVVAHVILPLLLALGWSEQLLAVEWQRIDLAVFWGAPTDAAHCQLVCEAKVIGHALQDVRQQAIGYTDKYEMTNCHKILLADGGRFFLFRRTKSKWEEKPSGYLNVRKLREKHLYPPDTNAVDTLVALTPSNIAG